MLALLCSTSCHTSETCRTGPRPTTELEKALNNILMHPNHPLILSYTPWNCYKIYLEHKEELFCAESSNSIVAAARKLYLTSIWSWKASIDFVLLLFFSPGDNTSLWNKAQRKKKVLSVHLMDFMLGFYPQEVMVSKNTNMPKPAILIKHCMLLTAFSYWFCLLFCACIPLR